MDHDVLMFAQVMFIIMTSLAALVAITLGARILWRWGSRTRPSNAIESGVSDDRLRHLETAVDSIAIEVERISEAQRFMVGLLGDSSQLRRGDRADLLPHNRPGKTNTPH